MSWLSWRSNILVLLVVTALFLIGAGNIVGVPLYSSVIGINITTLLAIGQGAIIFAFWKRYV